MNFIALLVPLGVWAKKWAAKLRRKSIPGHPRLSPRLARLDDDR